MNKYTPGPWRVQGEMGYLIKADSLLPNKSHHSTLATICQRAPHKTQGCGISDETAQANAHLIAASPELLDACRATLVFVKEEYPLEHGDPRVGDLWGKLEQAIAKAEGS